MQLHSAVATYQGATDRVIENIRSPRLPPALGLARYRIMANHYAAAKKLALRCPDAAATDFCDAAAILNLCLANPTRVTDIAMAKIYHDTVLRILDEN